MRSLSGAQVVVLGAGRSGRAAASLALRKGARVRLLDESAQCEPLAGADCHFGALKDADFCGDLGILSPGFALTHPLAASLTASCGELWGELGFADAHLPREIPRIAITGTNGKSTVTSFTAQLLQQAGLKTFAGGNLGTPLSEASTESWDALVIEVSSYQLELLGGLHPKAAVIMNLSPDHLARHGSMEHYAAIKSRIFEHMGPEDLAVLPADDPLLSRSSESARARRAWIGKLPGVILEGRLARFSRGVKELHPAGINALNAAVALLLAQELVPLEALDTQSLQGLPHRMELALERHGRRWINDSKSTNVEATLAALSAQAPGCVLLLGGQPKEGSRFSLLREAIERCCSEVIVFGAAAEELAAALEDLSPRQASSMAEACALAAEISSPGMDILLSPACASFDAYRNFAQRGEHFRSLAGELG